MKPIIFAALAVFASQSIACASFPSKGEVRGVAYTSGYAFPDRDYGQHITEAMDRAVISAEKAGVPVPSDPWRDLYEINSQPFRKVFAEKGYHDGALFPRGEGAVIELFGWSALDHELLHYLLSRAGYEGEHHDHPVFN